MDADEHVFVLARFLHDVGYHTGFIGKGSDAMRTERCKFIRYRELEGMNELCALRQDPYELSNLIAAPANEAGRQQMEAGRKRLLAP